MVLSSPALTRVLAQPWGVPSGGLMLAPASLLRVQSSRSEGYFFLACLTALIPGVLRSGAARVAQLFQLGEGPAVVCVQQRKGPTLRKGSRHSVNEVNLGGQPANPQPPLLGRKPPKLGAPSNGPSPPRQDFIFLKAILIFQLKSSLCSPSSPPSPAALTRGPCPSP